MPLATFMQALPLGATPKSNNKLIAAIFLALIKH